MYANIKAKSITTLHFKTHIVSHGIINLCWGFINRKCRTKKNKLKLPDYPCFIFLSLLHYLVLQAGEEAA